MLLKNFQEKAIKALEFWLDQLQEQQKKDQTPKDSFDNAWRRVFVRYGERAKKNYQSRKDAGNREFPNACINIPTGGGKTFIATYALINMMNKLRGGQRGLALWVIHNKALYEQTLNVLEKRSSAVHQRLRHLSGDRLRILTKDRMFSKRDVENNLCVMVLTTGSIFSNSKERLRFDKANGWYRSFFPDSGNIKANREFIDDHKGLNIENNIPVPSLANTIRMCRPVVIVDESHRASTALALDEASKLNPSIVLEITATPTEKSNVLYTAFGSEVWNEELIKLPIKVHWDQNEDWKNTIKGAVEQRKELEKLAKKEQKESGRYIRPIAIIRAEHTSRSTIGRRLHVNEIKDHLMQAFAIPAEHIAIQTSEKKELTNIDLLSDTCLIRYILTKDALREGWDCPFASILAILSTYKVHTGVTQLLGRVMRQPHAKRLKTEELNLPYVFCSIDSNHKAITITKKMLEENGYKDSLDLVEIVGGGVGSRIKTQRRPEFSDCKFYLPKIKMIENKKSREFNYDQDLLPLINWDELEYDRQFHMRKRLNPTTHVDSVGIGATPSGTSKYLFIPEDEFDLIYLTDRLLDVVPNIFIAAKIINSALEYHLQKNLSFDAVYTQRINLVEHIKIKIEKQIAGEAKNIFDNLIREKKLDICLKGWKGPEFSWHRDENKDIYNQQKSLFEQINTSSLTDLEQKAVDDFEDEDAVQSWLKMLSNNVDQGYSLQGWKRDRVWPDFLVALHPHEGAPRKFFIIETKGDFLDNPDTHYKNELMDTIERAILNQTKEPTYYFRLIKSGEWQAKFNGLLEEAAAH